LWQRKFLERKKDLLRSRQPSPRKTPYLNGTVTKKSTRDLPERGNSQRGTRDFEPCLVCMPTNRNSDGTPEKRSRRAGQDRKKS